MTDKALQEFIKYVEEMAKTPEYIAWKKRKMISEFKYLRREIDKLTAELIFPIAGLRKRIKIKIAKLQKQLAELEQK